MPVMRLFVLYVEKKKKQREVAYLETRQTDVNSKTSIKGGFIMYERKFHLVTCATKQPELKPKISILLYTVLGKDKP